MVPGRTQKRQREDSTSTQNYSNMGAGVMRMFFDEVSGFNPRTYQPILMGPPCTLGLDTYLLPFTLANFKF